MISVESIDLRSASDDEVVAVHAVGAAIARSFGLPEELLWSPEQALTDYRTRPAFQRRLHWVAREAGRVVGVASCIWDDVESNRDHTRVMVDVHPEEQGRGIGRLLLAEAVRAARHEFDARLLDGEAREEDDRAERFLRSFGFEPKIREPWNVTPLATIDRRLLTGWVEAAPAADYELVAWDGACPDDELAAAYVAASDVMNSAPTDDLDREDDVFTVEQLREWEANAQRRQVDLWTLLAVERETGEVAGLTEMLLPRNWPVHAWQGDTGVVHTHRRRGIGRWLKAVMALRLLEERPAVTHISTTNAASNEAMLAINHAMGFTPAVTFVGWQGDAKKAADLLGVG